MGKSIIGYSVLWAWVYHGDDRAWVYLRQGVLIGDV